MTDKAKKKRETKELPRGALSGLHIEADRTGRGMSLVLCGIIGVGDFSENQILLLSHGGRITVTGRRLRIKVLESNSVEIVGPVEGVAFKYGKN